MRTFRVNFTSQASIALAAMSERTGLDRGEIIRRALSLYQWSLNEITAGSRLAIVRPVEMFRLPIIGAVRGHEMRELILDFGEAADVRGGDDE